MKLFIIPPLIVLVFSLFKLFFPHRTPKELDLSKMKENERKYANLELLAVPLIFLSVGLICGCVVVTGILAKDIFFSTEYEYIVAPTNTFWIFPGCVLGFGLIRIPMEFVYKTILKDEYALYTHYTNIKHGYDGEKLWRPLEIIITIFGIILFVLGLNWFVRFDDKGKFEANELFSIKTHTYNLADITEICRNDNLTIKKNIERHHIYYIIKMIDGYEWDSNIYRNFSSLKDEEKLKEKIEEVSKLTETEIKYKQNY